MSEGIQHGKTVQIFMPDGRPTGIRYAEVVNWTGQAIACPRHRVKDLSDDWPETTRPGVYMLFGDGETSLRPAVYVGEGENVFRRLAQHVGNSEREWQRVVFFTSKDDNLTKAHVRYLEQELIRLSIEARRVEVTNKQLLTDRELPRLSRADRAAMNEFLDYAKLLLGALGFPSLEPAVASRSTEEDGDSNDEEELVFSFEVPRRGVEAHGWPTDDGFLVRRGARGVLGGSSLQVGYQRLQSQLIEDGIMREEEGRVELSEDYVFGSPSAAAAVLVGYNISGRQCWKADGYTLADWEADWLDEESE